MREGLAERWRDPQAQRRSGTKRTPREQVAEINRGYDWVKRLLVGAVARSPQRVDVQTLLAGVYFDQAEFLYGLEVELATYTTTCATRPLPLSGPRPKNTGVRWPRLNPSATRSMSTDSGFRPRCGTSDLAYLTKQDEPDQTQVERIAAALASWECAAAGKHQELFATAIVDSLDQAPPPLVSRYLVRQALTVVGEHPAARPVAERLAYYDELLKEVELRLALDGGDRVGRGRPFGVHVSLAATSAVFRENNNFALLLQALPPHLLGGSGDAGNSRQLLERELRDKLSEQFGIEALVFHPPGTQSRAASREGWQQLPVAYVVLKTKDEAVDRLPPVQLDLDFSDGSGEMAGAGPLAGVTARRPRCRPAASPGPRGEGPPGA